VIKSRRIRWVGHVTHFGEMRNVYKILVGKSGVKSPLRRSSHKWEENIKMDIMEIRIGSMDWIHLVQDRDDCQDLVNAVINL
jgi:hypothetical protein